MPELSALTNADLSPAATPITSGADPVDVDPNVRYYEVTTGGTGGEEIINLPYPDRPVGGFANGAFTGQRINIILKTQTDPGDVLKFTTHGNPGYNIFPAAGLPVSFDVSGTPPQLDFEGAQISFVWCSFDWLADLSATSNNFTGADGIKAYIKTTQAEFTDLETSDPGVSGQMYIGLDGSVKLSGQAAPLYFVASLPDVSTIAPCTRAWVTDSTQTLAAGIGTTVTGGGSHIVPVYSDGTDWIIG
jgi:hypothetical protein